MQKLISQHKLTHIKTLQLLKYIETYTLMIFITNRFAFEIVLIYDCIVYANINWFQKWDWSSCHVSRVKCENNTDNSSVVFTIIKHFSSNSSPSKCLKS